MIHSETTAPARAQVSASGDPAVTFDSEGTAYFASINFARVSSSSDSPASNALR